LKDSTPIEFVVSANDARLRLDQFLAKRLPEYSRSRIQQLIRTGFVRLNEQTTRPRQIVRSGDKINLVEPPLEKIETLPEPIPLDVLFEDDDLIVINKPAGLTVHPLTNRPGSPFTQVPASANTLWSMRCSATARRYRGSVEKSGPGSFIGLIRKQAAVWW